MMRPEHEASIKIYFRDHGEDVETKRIAPDFSFVRWMRYKGVTRSSLIRAMRIHDKMKGQSPDVQL